MGRKPNPKHLVTFGTEVHVIANWDYRSKFDARTKQGHLVGFTSRSNTHPAYIQTRETVVVTSDIIIQPHTRPIEVLGKEAQESTPAKSVTTFDEIRFFEDQDEVKQPPIMTASNPKAQRNLVGEISTRMKNEGMVNKSFEDDSINEESCSECAPRKTA